jgi:hypothetical protein
VSVRFACPHCRAVLRGPSRKAGQTIPCPKCRNPVIVPPPAQVAPALGIALDDGQKAPPAGVTQTAAPADEPLADDTELYDDYTPPPPNLPPLLVALGVAAVFAVGLVLAVVLLAPSSTPRAPGPGPVWSPAPAEDVVARGVARAEAGATTVVFLGVMLVWVVLALLFLVAWLLMLIWVVKDCRDRGVDGGVLWMLAILVLHFVGLIIYLASRPQGPLVPCNSCGNRRLAYAKLCPHCGREAA